MPREYPKLLLICATFIVAFLLLHFGYLDFLHYIKQEGVVWIFIAGLLFSSSFTAAFSIAAFIEMAPFVNPILAAPIAGFGAFIADYVLFSFLRFSIDDEVDRLKQTRLGLWIRRMIFHPSLSEKQRLAIILSIAGAVIASPLPDEIGISMLSSVKQITPRTFMMLCFALNTLGILLMLLLART